MHTVICAVAPATPELKRGVNELFRTRGCHKNVLCGILRIIETGAASVLLPPDYEEKPKRYESVGRIRCAETKVYSREKTPGAFPMKTAAF